MTTKVSTPVLAIRLHAVLDRLKDAHVAIFADCKQFRVAEHTSEELVDIGFVLRQVEELADELRKEAKAHKELAGKTIASRCLEAAVANPDSAVMTTRGTLATGVSDVRMEAVVPNSSSPEYGQLLEWCGVPDSVVKSGLLKVDFKKLGEAVTEAASRGAKIPGAPKTWPVPFTTFRKRS